MSKEEKNIPVSEAQADAAEEMKEAEAIEETENAELAAAIKASEEAKAAAEEYKRKWYSVTAEYDNYRKRTASTRATAYAEGRADVVGKLFPVADNLERALLSCGDEKTHKGIEMVLQAFQKILEDEKIAPIDPVGQPFDPRRSCPSIPSGSPLTPRSARRSWRPTPRKGRKAASSSRCSSRATNRTEKCCAMRRCSSQSNFRCARL